MSIRLFHGPAFPIALVFLWNAGLLALTAQPVPSNDAFFYDGPVVNFILHGRYINPALALALPISGTRVFSAYPPLYQALLLGWMTLFGVSALSAMVFHLALLGTCLWLLDGIFRRLSLPVWTARVAAAFLLVITFHDRPDSLAHVFGLAAVCAWLRSWQPLGADSQPRSRSQAWAWAAVGLVLLSLAAVLQIGAVYFLVVWIGMIANNVAVKDRFLTAPLLGLALLPAAFVALVAVGFPHLWAGFLEHARQTPSLTGLRTPRLADILKIVRTVPGILAVAALLPWWSGRHAQARKAGREPLWVLTLACTSAGTVVVVAAMFLLLPQSVSFASYLQPLVVGCHLALVCPSDGNTAAGAVHGAPPFARWQVAAFVALAALGSIRAVGMSTWGVACAADVGYPTTLQRVRSELDGCPPGTTIVASGAYLYEAALHNTIRAIHSDWLGPWQRSGQNSDLAALVALKPSKLILTQFDFYRRYEPTLAQLKSSSDLRQFGLINTARIRPPDSFPSLQKVVQHLSWAPVVVTLSWK